MSVSRESTRRAFLGCAVGAVGYAQQNPPAGTDSYDLEARLNRRIEASPEYLDQQPTIKATITVDSEAVTGSLNPLFVGYNLEDLSYEIHPGLSAQMLYGESFEDEPDIELPAGWRAHLEPANEETPKDPALLRKWRGAWSIEDGVVTLVGSRQRRIYTDQVKMTNGTVECEVMEPAYERNHWGPGLLVCWKSNVFYYVYLAPERSVVVLAKGSDPRFTQSAKVLSQRKMKLDYGRWYKVAVDIHDGHIAVMLDGDTVMNYTDPEPLTGGVGLESSFCISSFRNLTVTPEGKAPWKADFSLSERPYTHVANISRWWDPVITGDSQVRYKWEKENPYNTDRCQMIEFVSGRGAAGVSNTGLHNWGLTFRKGWGYQGRLYLRGDYAGTVTLALQSRDGAKTYAAQKLTGVAKDWKRFDIQLRSSEDDTNGRFALWIDSPGRIFADQVVLMPGPEGLYKGLPVRKDTAEKMVAGIRHIRFGGDMINTYGFDWKQMTLPADKRRQYQDGWNYHKSAQFMIFEFIDFCRAAGVEPIINLGEHLPAEDLADFVEYCNGDGSREWSRKRIENGRREPYGLRYIMYGNGLPAPDRVQRLLSLLQDIDPKVRLIMGDVGHTPWFLISNRSPERAAAVNKFAAQLEAMSSRPEVSVLGSNLLWSETIQAAMKGFPALRSGETHLYAEEVNGSGIDWQRGLDDALMAVTSEGYGGVVWGLAYCNALQASGHLYEWNQGHVHFNSSTSWYQPPGWVVRMLAENLQALAIKADAECPKLRVLKRAQQGQAETSAPALTVSASRDAERKTLVLKVVNLWGGPVQTRIDLHGLNPVKSAQAVVMSSLHLKGKNTPEQPLYIAPRQTKLSTAAANMDYTFEPGSFTILRFQSEV